MQVVFGFWHPAPPIITHHIYHSVLSTLVYKSNTSMPPTIKEHPHTLKNTMPDETQPRLSDLL